MCEEREELTQEIDIHLFQVFDAILDIGFL